MTTTKENPMKSTEVNGVKVNVWWSGRHTNEYAVTLIGSCTVVRDSVLADSIDEAFVKAVELVNGRPITVSAAHAIDALTAALDRTALRSVQ